MTFVLADTAKDILGSLVCFGIVGLLIAAAVWAGIKEARWKAGVEIPLDDVPQHIRDAAERLAPKMTIAKVVVKFRTKQVPRKFEFHGDVAGKPIEVEVMPRQSHPQIREIEVIYQPAYRRLEGGKSIEVSQVPRRIAAAAREHMERIDCHIKEIDRARVGTIFDRNAFELKGTWTGGRFEMKVMSDGEVIKVEIKYRSDDRSV